MLRSHTLIVSLALLLAPVAVMAAPVSSTVTVGSEQTVITLSPERLAGLPRRSVTATGHDGVPATYDGVEVVHLLEKAGFPVGAQLRGKNVSAFVVADAADGYRVVFALAELDPAFREGIVLLADKRDGKALPEGEGPFRLVVPAEKRPARWIRQLRSLSLQFAR